MAIARVNFDRKAGSGPVSTFASDATSLTAGNLIVVGFRSNGSVSGVSDTAGNTYTLDASRTDDGAAIGLMYVWHAWNCLGNASNVVTVAGTNMDFLEIVTVQYSGIATAADPHDITTSQTQNTNSTSFTSSTFTTALATEVILSFATGNSAPTYTAGSGFALIGSGTVSMGVQEEFVSTIQTGATSSMSSTSNQHWYYINVSFKAPVTNTGNFLAFM